MFITETKSFTDKICTCFCWRARGVSGGEPFAKFKGFSSKCKHDKVKQRRERTRFKAIIFIIILNKKQLSGRAEPAETYHLNLQVGV